MKLEVQSIENNTAQILRNFVRDGIAGNMQVLYEMIRITRKSVSYDLGLKKLAADILIYNNLDSTSKTEEIFNTLFNFAAKQNSVIIGYDANKQRIYNTRENSSQKYIAYIQDVSGSVENIKEARRTISDGFGDCDDHAILNASLLGCLGYENVSFVMAKYNASDNTFSHIYVEAFQDGKRYVFDTTLPNAKLNSEVQAVEKRSMPIFNDVKGLDGFSGFYLNTKSQVKKLGKAVTEIIPQAVNFLPLGFIAGNALSASAQLVNYNGTKELSFSETASNINTKLDEIIRDLLTSAIAYDLAKSHTLQISAQINAVSNIPEYQKGYAQIKQSIKDKIDFIGNFPNYAKENNIRLVYLNSNLILTAFAGIAGFTGFRLYKHYYKKG